MRLVETPTSAPRPRRRTCSSAASAPTARGENGLVLFLACDNLVKGAALNAIQIAERVLDTAWRPLTSA